MKASEKLALLNRRSFLRGLGASVSLPLLDFMYENPALAQSSGPALRYFLMFNGISISRMRNGDKNLFVPNNTGANYDIRRGMAPINNYSGLKDYISVASNLTLPYTITAESTPAPRAGYRGQFHNVASDCQLTGMRVDQDQKVKPTGPSSDRLLSSRMGYGNDYKHINFSVQPSAYKGNTSLGSRAILQFGNNGNKIAPQSSPQAFFREMFGGLADSDDRAENARQAAIRERKSILDLLDARRVEYLNKLASSQSRQRLEDHFDHIRTIENSLQDVEVSDSGLCLKPSDPGSDPGKNGAYSNENKRAEVMTELIAMAFACDISRVGTMSLTISQSFMSVQNIIGVQAEYHQMSHGDGSDNDYADMQAWHVGHYCRLLNRLRDMEEAGGNVLDNSAILLASEGGGGRNSETGRGNSPHCGDNMCTLIAGKAGGLKGGVHVRTDKAHPTKVMISGMKAAGMTQNDLNQVSGAIPELFV